MIRRTVPALLLLIGCGDSSSGLTKEAAGLLTGGSAAERAEEDDVTSQGAKTQVEEDGVERLRCPESTTLAGNPPLEQWCERNAKMHGPYLRKHESGTRAISGTYKNNKTHGDWTWWYESGATSSKGSYVDGKRIGSWTWWHENGTRSMTGDFLDDRKVGTWTSWHEDGSRSEMGGYVNGHKDGTWTTWSPQGAVTSTELWRMGEKR